MRLFTRPALDGPWVYFALIALTILMSSIDGTIVAVALPTLVADLDTSLVLAGWTITAYILTQSVMLPLGGKLAEQFGQMRVFLACVFLFTLGSLLCGLAPNVYALVACRVIQAIGGGGFFPAATGIVAQKFPETRNRMLGLFASIYPIGGLVGPNLGGAVIEHFGWRAIFLINVPLGVVIIAILARFALTSQTTTSPAGRMLAPHRPAGKRRIDLLGTLLFALMIVCLLLALTELGEDPSMIRSPIFWGLLAGSLLSLLALVWQERRAPDPMLDLDLIWRPPYAAVNAYNLVTGACFMSFFSFIPYYATVQYGMGPLESGAILTPRSLVMIAASTIISFVMHRVGYRLPMLLGTAGVAGALLLLSLGLNGVSLGPLETGPLIPLLFIMALSGGGMGLLIPSSNNAGVDLLPERTAVMSSIRGLFHTGGGVIGTAIIVVWLELSPSKAEALHFVFLMLGLIVLATIPIIYMIPDRASERLRAEKRAREAEIEVEAAATHERLAAPAPAPERLVRTAGVPARE